MDRQSQRSIAVMIFALSILLFACGGSGESAGGQDGRSIEPCSLITAAEAEAWLGGPVDPPAPYTGPDPEPTCVYKSPGAQTQILLQVYDGEVYYGGDNLENHPDSQPIDVGDKGFSEVGSVEFLQNDWTVSISRISGPVTEESLLAAALLVSSRLP